MFANIKQIFNSKNKDILKRVLFTLAALFVFKVGTSIIVPGVKVNTSGMSFLEVINAMSGGAFTKASIFAIGVTPYITAQIIVQLLSIYLTQTNSYHCFSQFGFLKIHLFDFY